MDRVNLRQYKRSINMGMKKLIELYLDYWNNFLSVSRFAEYYSLEEDDAQLLIEIGRKYYERQVEFEKMKFNKIKHLL